MSELLPKIGFTFDGEKVCVSMTSEAFDFLGGEDAPVYLAVVDWCVRIVASKRPGGRSCTMSEQRKSKLWPRRVQQNVAEIEGHKQGLTELEARFSEGPERWIEFDIPSNLSVKQDPRRQKSPELIMRELKALVVEARTAGLDVTLTGTTSKIVVEKFEF